HFRHVDVDEGEIDIAAAELAHAFAAVLHFDQLDQRAGSLGHLPKDAADRLRVVSNQHPDGPVHVLSSLDRRRQYKRGRVVSGAGTAESVSARLPEAMQVA